ncbi:hypothetical protein D3C73_1159770 [compost metagenome]
MAGIAVSRTIDQISAPIPLFAFAGVWRKAPLFQKQQIPGRHAKAQIERKRQIGQRIFLIDRFHSVDKVGIQRFDVRVAQAGVRGIGHGGVEVGAVGTDTVPDRAGKLLFAVTADTLDVGRGDVGGVNHSHGGTDAITAGKRRTALRFGMACLTVGGDGNLLAFFNQRRTA